jgi:hypothetical protein
MASQDQLPQSTAKAEHPTALPEATTGSVTVRTNGNVFVRRGPALAFDPVSVLMSGQTVAASGRDVLTEWLQVSVAGDPPRGGWISIMTGYTEVHGNVASLPEIYPSEWPRLAFVRNCSFHQMVLEPGGIVIPAVQNFPENDVRVNPGQYTVHDADEDTYPEVQEIEIREGSEADILVDGTGQKKKCPLP